MGFDNSQVFHICQIDDICFEVAYLLIFEVIKYTAHFT